MVLWFNHNEVREGKAQQSRFSILSKAWYLLDEFQIANLKLSQTMSKDEIQWALLDDLWYKVNVDATIFSSTNSIGIGTLIRDHEGRVEAAISKSILIPLALLEAKAKALEESVFFAWDVGVRDVIFEYDSQIVGDAVNDLCEPPTTIGNIIDCIWQKLQDFRRTKVSHICRQGNRPAHILAWYASHIIGFITWIKEIPYMIESAMTQDVLFLSSS